MQNKNFNKYLKLLTDKTYENINESQTIDWLIAPMLRDFFEWDREDPEEVKAQWRKITDGEKENPVDFALFVPNQTKPIALIEAKRLNEKLTGKPVSQAISYCISANVRWAVLTNGLEWKVYDALDLSKDELTDRLLFQVNILDFIENRSGMNNVDLISKSKIESLEQIIQNQKIKNTIQNVFDLNKNLNLFTDLIANHVRCDKGLVKQILEQYELKINLKNPHHYVINDEWHNLENTISETTPLKLFKIKSNTTENIFDFKNWNYAFETIITRLFFNYDKLQSLFYHEPLKSYFSLNKESLYKDYVLDSAIKEIKGGFFNTQISTQNKIKIICLIRDFLKKNNEPVEIQYTKE